MAAAPSGAASASSPVKKRRRVSAPGSSAHNSSLRGSQRGSLRGSTRLHHHSHSNVERTPFVAPDGKVLTKIVHVEESSSAWVDGDGSSSLGDSANRYGSSDDSYYYSD
eukprot:Amastigsp_a1150_8.p3 type:complete len:109 gc:universal Amastigsp_a1150_8:445-119(-)